MKKSFLKALSWKSAFAGTDHPDALIPEIWAAEGLRVLYANSVMLPLVHTDFKNEIQKFGDIVNTRRPDTMTAGRKVDGDTITFGRPTTTNIPIKLNQHIYQSFVIYDGEESKAFKDLVEEYLEPAVESIVELIDQVLLMQGHQFWWNGNIAGSLGTAADEDTVIAADKVLNDNKVKGSNRYFVVDSKMQADLLSVAQFVEADKVGDAGTALRTGSLGSYYGFSFVMSHNAPTIATGNTTKTNAVKNASGYSAGDTSIEIDGAGTPAVGEFCTIVGDMVPHLITGYSSNTLTIYPALQSAVADDAVVTTYTAGAINYGSGYDADYTKEMVVNGFSVTPQTGQLCAIGASASTDPIYGIVGSPDTTGIYVDRGLDSAVSNSDTVGIGPSGSYAFAFHKNAIGFITRPLAAPRGKNVDSAVMNYKGLGLRVTMGYDMDTQGTKVTIDVLAGVKTLNADMGCSVFA